MSCRRAALTSASSPRARASNTPHSSNVSRTAATCNTAIAASTPSCGGDIAASARKHQRARVHVTLVMTHDHEYFHAVVTVTQQHHGCRRVRLRNGHVVLMSRDHCSSLMLPDLMIRANLTWSALISAANWSGV